MAARKLGSLLRQHFFSLFFLFVGCFFFPKGGDCRQKKRKKKKLRTVSSGLSSSWTSLKRVFLSTTRISKPRNQTPPNGQLTTLTSARSSHNSLVTLTTTTNQPDPETRIENGFSESDSPLCDEIFPCTTCGEIFPKTNLLEHHITVKHAVTELTDGESSTNIVKIIFKSGWPDHQGNNRAPEIHRILKIHNSPKILTRFEEYREFVKAKAARSSSGGGGVRRWDDGRCVADGNELLRFYCSTFMCDLGRNGGSSLCGHQYCSVCGIIGAGFSPKLDGIATLATGWRGHAAVPEEVEEEFGFMNVKRAMLVCRVVAGRVGCDLIEDDDVDKSDGGYDSVVGQGSGSKSGALLRIDDEELIVFNPRAVLPCFVIVYTV
ncbi:hypothetical protein Bca52824_028321 [Brassica carinata]|uniref:C2H2-type domain-containing protein n=1 Tax=Brassica carinata TaxID=52824 RepID=A0A8X8APU2_BRACI|nr:hypothetical protein Bca52824_028321 [Brassica carinata]